MSPGRRCAQTRPSLRPSEGRGAARRSVRVASSGENWCCPNISLAGSSVDSDHRKFSLGPRTRLKKQIDVVEVGYVSENNEPMVIKVSTVRGSDNEVQLQDKGKKVDESDQESARESTGSSDQYETFEIDENTEYSSVEEEEEIRERKGYKKEVEGVEGSPAKKRRPDQKQVNKFSVIDPRRQAIQEEEEHRKCCDNSEVGDDTSSSGSLVQEAAYSRPRDKITTSFSQPISKEKTDIVAARHSKSLPLPNWLLRKKTSRKFKRGKPNCERYRSSEVMPRCRSRDRTRCCRCSSKEDGDEDDEDDDSSSRKCVPGCKKALPIEISLQQSPHRRSHGRKFSDKSNVKFSKALTPIDPLNTNFFFGHTIDETILEMMHTLSLLKYNGSPDKKQNLSLCPAKPSHISSALTGNLMVQQSTFLRNALGSTVDEVLLSSYSRIRTMFQSKESKSVKEERERSCRSEDSELGFSSCAEGSTYRPIPELDKLSGLAIDDTVDVVNWLRDEYVALAEDEKLSKRQKKTGSGPLSPESLRQRRYVLDCLTQVMRKKKEMEDRKKDKQRTRTSVPRKRKGAAMLTMAPTNCPCSSPATCEHGTIPALLVQATPSEVARIKKLAQQSDGTTMFQPPNFSPTFADQAEVLNPVENSLPHPEGIQTCGYVSIESKETADDGPIVQELHFNKNAHFDSGQSDSLTYNSGYSFMTHGSRRHTMSTSYDSSISISDSSSTQCSRCFGSYQYEHRTESCLSYISESTGRKHRRNIRTFTPTQYTRTTEYQYSPSQSSVSETQSSYVPDLRFVESHISSDSTTDFSEISECEWNKRRRERLSKNAPNVKKHSENKLADKDLHCTYMTDKPFESSLEQLNFISSFTDSPDKFEEPSPNIQSLVDQSTTDNCKKPPISSSQAPLKPLSECNEKFEDLITKPPDCVIPCHGDAINVTNMCKYDERNQTCHKNTLDKMENQKYHRKFKRTNFSLPKGEITMNSETLPTGRDVGSVARNLRRRLMEEVKSKVRMAKTISNTSQKQESNNDCLPERCNETPHNSTMPVNDGLNTISGPREPASNMHYCPPGQTENNEFCCCREQNSNAREKDGETLCTVPRDIVEELEIYFQRNNNAYGTPRSQENNSYTKDQNRVLSPNYIKRIQNNPEFQTHRQNRNDRVSPNIHRQEEITCKSSCPQSRIEGPQCRILTENCKEFLSHPILKDRLSANLHEQEIETTKHPHPLSKVKAQCLKFGEKIENQNIYSQNPVTKDSLSPNSHKLKQETPACYEPTTQIIEKTPTIHDEIKTHKQCFPLRMFKERISPLIHKKQDVTPKCSCTMVLASEPSSKCCEEMGSGENTSPSRVLNCRASSIVNQQEEQISKTDTELEEREQIQKCHEKAEYHRQVSQSRVLKDGDCPNKEEYVTQGEIQLVNSSSHSLSRCSSTQHQTCENEGSNTSDGTEPDLDHIPCSQSENKSSIIPPRYEPESKKQCNQFKGPVRNASYLPINNDDQRCTNIRPRSVKSVIRSIEKWSSQESTNCDLSGCSQRSSSKASNEEQSSIKPCHENISLSEELCSNDTSNYISNDTCQHSSEIKLEPLEHEDETYIVPKSCVSPMNAPEVTDCPSVCLTRSAVVDLCEALLVPKDSEKKISESEKFGKPDNNNEVAKVPAKGTAEGDGLNHGRHALNPDQELIMNLSPAPIRISQTQSDTQASVRTGQDVKERRPRQHAYTLVDNITNRRLKKDKRTAERDSNITPEAKNTTPNLNSCQGKSEPSVEDLVAAIYRANVFYASHNMERTWNNFTMREITPPYLDKVVHATSQLTRSEKSETKVKEVDEMKEDQEDQNVENKPSEVISKRAEDNKDQNVENKPPDIKSTKGNKNVSNAPSDEKVKRKERRKTPKDELHSTTSQTNLHSRKVKETREVRKKMSTTKVSEKNKPSNKGVLMKYANRDGWQPTSRKYLTAAAHTSSDSQASKSHEKHHDHRERSTRLTHEHTSDKWVYIKPTTTPSRPMRLFSYLTSRRQNEELCKEHRMLKVMHISAHNRYSPRMNHSSVFRYPPMEKEPSMIPPVMTKDIKRDRHKMHDERAFVPKRDHNISSPLARRLNNHIQNLSARYRKYAVGEKVRGRHSHPERTASISPPEDIRKIHSSPQGNRVKVTELKKRRRNVSLDRNSRRFSLRAGASEGTKSSARMSLMQIAKNPPFGLHRRLPVQNQKSAPIQNPQNNPKGGDEKQRKKKPSKQKVTNDSPRNEDNKPQKMEDKATEMDLRGKKRRPSGGPQDQIAAKSSPTKVLWAITRINIFEDNSRTYEVMKPTYKTPKKIPSTTEGLFALTPQ